MKKLIYIANIRLPTEKAHSLQIMKMCEAFAVCGVDVELVVPDKRNNLGEYKLFEYYGVKTHFKIRKIPSTDFLGRTRRFGRLFYRVDLLTFLFNLCLVSGFEKASVIYSRDTILFLPFTGKSHKLLAEIHSLPERQYFFLKLLRRASGIITVTQYLKKILVEFGLEEKRVIVAPDGVDIEAFNLPLSKMEARQKLVLPEDKILLGYAGMLKTMGMEKGIATALESLKTLPKNISLVLVGGHPADVEFYKKSAKNLDLEDRVVFVGRVAPNMVPLYLKSFDLVIAPFPENKHYRYFMSPLKLFEYMASGVPIIASDLPSLREVIDESMAYFFEPDDSKSLARTIEYVLAHQEEAHGKAMQSLEKVKEYSWNLRAKKIIKFIDL